MGQRDDEPSGGHTLGGVIGEVIDTATGSVTGLGKLLGETFRLPGFGASYEERPSFHPGASPGIEHHLEAAPQPAEGEVRITCTDYGVDALETRTIGDVSELTEGDRTGPQTVRWIHVMGINPHVVNHIREVFGFHTLAAEDVMHVPQRPRCEAYEDHLFMVMRLFQQGATGGTPSSQQIGIFMGPELVVTFQQTHEECWGAIHKRLRTRGSRIRGGDGTYLGYAIVDSVVDHVFPVLEQYAGRIDGLEDAIAAHASSDELHAVHAVKRELAVLRRVLMPTREVVAELRRPEHTMVSDMTRNYLRDVQDHCLQALDMVETFHDLAKGLTDLYLSMSSQRTNEVMQVLTIIATIFIPITFLAGVYGMNFDHLPELHWKHGYATFWGVSATVTLALVIFFRRRGWLK